MHSSQIRHIRINQLYQIAKRGVSNQHVISNSSIKKQIIKKALSMGVTKRTANEYYESVQAMLEMNKK